LCMVFRARSASSYAVKFSPWASGEHKCRQLPSAPERRAGLNSDRGSSSVT